MRSGLINTTLFLVALLIANIPQATSLIEKNGRSIVEFYGMCDASGAVRISDSLFMVADDEDNIMRIYDAEKGGYPVDYLDLTTELIPRLHPGGSLAERDIDVTKELDLEAGTRVGDVSYWITSHAVSKKGKHRNERFQFLALSHDAAEGRVRVLGEPFPGLMDAMVQHPQLAAYTLKSDTHCAADPVQTINIEGMTARSEGGVFIGFRKPVPEGRALVVGLENPDDVIRGLAPEFGDVIELDLDGLGVRGLIARQDGYIIAAGDQDAGPVRALYSWAGVGAEPIKLPVELAADFNPETFFNASTPGSFMVLSDDGDRSVQGGQQCKKLKDFTQKSFRGIWVQDPV